MKHRYAEPLMLSGILFFLCMSCVLVFSTVQRILRVEWPTEFNLIASLALPFLFIFWRYRSYAVGFSILSGVFLASMFAIGALTSNIWDATWDGQAYHLPSIIHLTEHWNPFASESPYFLTNVYPNGWWTILSNISLLYESIEAAKVLNFALLVLTIQVVYGVLRVEFSASARVAVFITLAIVLNHVVVVQLYTFYLDGSLYLILVLLACGMALLNNSEFRILGVLIVGSGLILSINTKFTGLYFAFFICVLYCIIFTIRRGRLPVKDASLFLFFTAIAVSVIGFRPYVTNFAAYGSVLHSPSEQILSGQIPEDFEDMNGVKQFFYSSFAVAKVPKSADHQWQWNGGPHKRHYAAPDARMGGFGQFYGLMFIISIFVLLGLFLSRKRITVPAMLMGYMLLVALVFPSPWWARLVPVAWLIPLVVPIWSLLEAHTPKGVRVLSYTMLSFVIFSSVIAFAFSMQLSLRATTNYMERISTMRALNGTIVIETDKPQISVRTWQYRLESEGIESVITTEELCTEPVFEVLNLKFCRE